MPKTPIIIHHTQAIKKAITATIALFWVNISAIFALSVFLSATIISNNFYTNWQQSHNYQENTQQILAYANVALTSKQATKQIAGIKNIPEVAQVYYESKNQIIKQLSNSGEYSYVDLKKGVGSLLSGIFYIKFNSSAIEFKQLKTMLENISPELNIIKTTDKIPKQKQNYQIWLALSLLFLSLSLITLIWLARFYCNTNKQIMLVQLTAGASLIHVSLPIRYQLVFVFFLSLTMVLIIFSALTSYINQTENYIALLPVLLPSKAVFAQINSLYILILVGAISFVILHILGYYSCWFNVKKLKNNKHFK